MNYNSPIFEWDMTPQEIEAYRLAVLYEKEFRANFSKDADGQMIRRNTIPKRGDPRKSNLFRHCWKLCRETRGLLENHEYPLYIKANLTIIKAHNGRIEPNSVCGDKAWVRYKVYKRLYDQKLSELAATAPPPSVSTTNPKIIQEIDRTKKFLFEKSEGNPTLESIKSFFERGFFKMWVATGKISTFYVALSPFVQKSCDLNKFANDCSFSLALVNEKITEEVRNYFKWEYKHEFIS